MGHVGREKRESRIFSEVCTYISSGIYMYYKAVGRVGREKESLEFFLKYVHNLALVYTCCGTCGTCGT